MKRLIPAMILLGAMMTTPATMSAQEGNAPKDTLVQKKKKTFGQKLIAPLKWIGRNWSDYDPHYSIPSFYNWATQIQNTTTQEWLNMQSPEGMDLRMKSKMSNRFGPYLGYQWLFYGFTVDLNTIGKSKSKGKNEFTLSVNSNLLNLDIIRRRTGGDFTINNLEFNNEETGPVDMTDFAQDYAFGDLIRNSLTGFNLNVFTNHRRYSNPAAFSNGAIQLRSVGSPIIGFGYTHQKVNSEVSSIFARTATELMFGSIDLENDPRAIKILDELEFADIDDDKVFYDLMGDLFDIGWENLKTDRKVGIIAQTFLSNRIPTVTRIDDWHLQLGYAYNLVFSRRLLLGLSAIASPGFKRVKANNFGSFSYVMADQLSRLIKKHENMDVPADYFHYDYNDSHFNVNAFFRASLTFNFNRWRAGLNASFSHYFFKDNDMKVHNGYGSLVAYVGYCFGRSKKYRYNGERRQEYIMAALTKKQIEEMKDTMPAGNIDKGASYGPDEGRTRKYHKDEFNLNIQGCDLVMGPEGKYGWYEVEDGYITPGQDTESRLCPGKQLEVDKDGTFVCEAGHENNFRTGNWWKSQLSINQTPDNWYPEMLHYALRGKMTLYLRGRIFGTKSPVKVEIEDFCINHGKEAKSFFQMGIKSFRSRSTYSIEGRCNINGKDCRVYIEQKKRGKMTNLYFSRIMPFFSNWMKDLDGNQTVSSVSMPGTHDAGSSSLVESPIFRNGHTQNFSVDEQLSDGIRAFDIRLKKSLKYGHTFTCRDSFDSTMVAWDQFLTDHPSEFIVALVGSDEGGKWGEQLTENYKKLIKQYPHRFVENFDPTTKIDDVRGKILVIRRQEDCPFGKLLKFEDNAVFESNGFHVEDVYKQFKTYKKIKIVEQNIREAYENEDPAKWYITFNSIAWSPRRHNPYSYAWGARNIRKPMNKSLNEIIELKDYTNFGIVFLDFYNDHGDNPKIVESIIQSNFFHEEE